MLRLERCDIVRIEATETSTVWPVTIETSETSTLRVETGHMSVLATKEMSATGTGPMRPLAPVSATDVGLSQ